MMILQQTRGVLSSGGVDRLAARYISAVESAGANVSADQKTAIDSFFKQGKIDGWLSSMRRIYLPIWGAAAPNAIDLIGLDSGSFVGGVTHGSGFVQSNGTTGYFNTGVAVNSLSGISTGSAYMAFLARNDTSAGLRVMGANLLEILRSGGSMLARIANNTEGQGQLSSSLNSMSGVISCFRSSGTRYNVRRTSSNRSILNSLTNGDFGVIPNINMFLMAGNFSGTPAQFNTAQFGSFAIGTGMTDAQDLSFTLALKNLWETCTGLTLP